MSPYATFESRIEVRGEIGCKYHHSVETLQLAQQHIYRRVRFTLNGLQGLRRTTGRDRICFIKEEHSALFISDPKYRRNVLWRFASPHRFHFGVPHDEQATPERLRNGLGANRFASTRRTSKVERETESGRMTLAQTPLTEDQVVVPNLGERHATGLGLAFNFAGPPG